MASTEFGLGNALAVQRWSNQLAVEAKIRAYFTRFKGEGPNNVLQVLKDLKKQAGDKITVGLQMKLNGDGVEGDNVIEGTSAEEAIDFYNDSLFVEQRRKSTKSKGKMSEQRVPYNMRKIGMDSLSTWWAEDDDQRVMIYLAGIAPAAALNPGYHFTANWTGRANNSLVNPATSDTDHMYWARDATGTTDVGTADKLSPAEIEKLIATAKTVDPMIQPIMVDGSQKHIFLMHPFNAFDLRTAYSDGDWGDIHRRADGKDNMIYKDALGEIGGVVLHEHRDIIRYAGSLVNISRCLFLGAQAGFCAYGGSGGPGRYSWNEDKDDRGNALAITAGCIVGEKAAIFNSKRFGMFAFDCACASPVVPD